MPYPILLQLSPPVKNVTIAMTNEIDVKMTPGNKYIFFEGFFLANIADNTQTTIPTAMPVI